jgi:hypothetical protein
MQGIFSKGSGRIVSRGVEAHLVLVIPEIIASFRETNWRSGTIDD